MNKLCTTCNGDGYINFTVKQWNNFLLWEKDPSEDKMSSSTDFPAFLKIPCARSVSKLDDNIMHGNCPVCRGLKFVKVKG